MSELHGVETIELTSGTVAVTTIQTAVLGHFGKGHCRRKTIVPSVSDRACRA